MNRNELLDSVLGMLRLIHDDEEKLQLVHDFMLDEIIEEDFTEVEIPEKYKSLVHCIAENIDCGMICFVNPQTLECIQIPKDANEYYGFDDNPFQEARDQIDKWEKFIQFEPLSSREGYQIMSAFADRLPEGRFKNRVLNALNNRKPFANFKNLVDDSKYRQDWFAFKQKQIEAIVYQNLIDLMDTKN